MLPLPQQLCCHPSLPLLPVDNSNLCVNSHLNCEHEKKSCSPQFVFCSCPSEYLQVSFSERRIAKIHSYLWPRWNFGRMHAGCSKEATHVNEGGAHAIVCTWKASARDGASCDAAFKWVASSGLGALGMVSTDSSGTPSGNTSITSCTRSKARMGWRVPGAGAGAEAGDPLVEGGVDGESTPRETRHRAAAAVPAEGMLVKPELRRRVPDCKSNIPIKAPCIVISPLACTH